MSKFRYYTNLSLWLWLAYFEDGFGASLCYTTIKHKIPGIQLEKLIILLKSAIIVVEDNGKDCVDPHSKEDGERQDPSL